MWGMFATQRQDKSAAHYYTESTNSRCHCSSPLTLKEGYTYFVKPYSPPSLFHAASLDKKKKHSPKKKKKNKHDTSRRLRSKTAFVWPPRWYSRQYSWKGSRGRNHDGCKRTFQMPTYSRKERKEKTNSGVQARGEIAAAPMPLYRV